MREWGQWSGVFAVYAARVRLPLVAGLAAREEATGGEAGDGADDGADDGAMAVTAEQVLEELDGEDEE